MLKSPNLIMCVFSSLIFLSLIASANPPAAPEAPEWFGATTPVRHYSYDSGADRNHVFGQFKTFSEYIDPDITEAHALGSPLDEERFRTYNLFIVINKKDHDYYGRGQTVRVYQRGVGLVYYWLVSTGRDGFDTLSGYFTPQRFSSRHWSNKYNAPMLWSVFFNGGMALHSSITRSDLLKLGKPASHGCVHVEDNRAKELFHMVGHSGVGTVEKINYATGNRRKIANSAEDFETEQNYRTLIIVAP